MNPANALNALLHSNKDMYMMHACTCIRIHIQRYIPTYAVHTL